MLALVIAVALFTGAQETPRAQDPGEARPQAVLSTQADANVRENADSDEDRVVCRRERVLGSNRPQRVCMTRRERAELRDAARNIHDRVMQEQPSSGGEAPY